MKANQAFKSLKQDSSGYTKIVGGLERFMGNCTLGTRIVTHNHHWCTRLLGSERQYHT